MMWLCERCRYCDAMKPRHSIDTSGQERREKRIPLVRCTAARTRGWIMRDAIEDDGFLPKGRLCPDYTRRR